MGKLAFLPRKSVELVFAVLQLSSEQLADNETFSSEYNCSSVHSATNTVSFLCQELAIYTKLRERVTTALGLFDKHIGSLSGGEVYDWNQLEKDYVGNFTETAPSDIATLVMKLY